MRHRSSRMWKIFGIILILGHARAEIRLDPLVNTNQGLIKGLQAEDGDYSMFLGIPFAIVNASNPFGASSPHPQFETVFEAHDDSAICPQVEEFENTIVGTLDCLHLNVYVPNSATSRKKLPVLVWIYGGGFTIGFAGRYLYGPKYLVQHDVLLVTVNYRVGPYGFMCLDIPEVPGNQGLKDQLLALRWVKENIAAFGGDVNKITIMGESAGAASVESHIYSNQEKLFDKAIIQSGSIASPWATTDSDSTVPLRLAEKLGFATDDLYSALTFLTNTDPKLVIGASDSLSLTYRVCVEKEFENIEQFITEHPENLDIPKAGTTPILLGYNSHEWLLQYLNLPPDFFSSVNIFNYNLNLIFDLGDSLKEMVDIVQHFYIGDEDLNENVRYELADFDSDFLFNYPAQRSISKLLQNGAPSIYHYVFSYSGGRNFVKSRNNITEGGALHADEIGYLFDISFEKSKPSVEDQLVIDMITTLWTNFVKFGNPTPEITELLPVKWLPVSVDELHYVDINSQLTAGKRPYNARSSFWDLFFETNGKYLKYRKTRK